MKKREFIIDLLSEFILQKPGRPFREIEMYASQLGASFEELKEALLLVNQTKFSLQQNVTRYVNTVQSFFQSVGKKILPKNFPSFSNHTSSDAQFKNDISVLYAGVITASHRQTNSLAKRLTPVFLFRKTARLSAPVKISLFLATSFCFSIFLTFLFMHIQKTPFTTGSVHSASTVSTPVSYDFSKRNSSSDPFSPPLVYASQEQLNAQKIFSYPGTPVTLQYSGTPKKEVLGFLPYWMLPVADQINLDGFTAVSLFGLTVDSNGNIITVQDDNTPDPGWAMWQSSELDSFIERARQKRIKIFLTIKSFDADTMNQLVASDEAQRTLIANTIQLVNSKSLDGVNVDFEYVGQAPPEVTSGFTRLIANLNSELKRQTPNAELTVDTYLSSGGVVNFFDIQLLQDYIDAFVVMGYDVHSPGSDAGALAPLEGGDSVLGYMQSYLERISPSKLILAVGYYGYDWPVVQDSSLPTDTPDPNATDSANTDTTQDQSPSTTTLPGPVRVLSYAEIAAESKRYTIQWDGTSQSPYYQYTDPDTGQLREVHFENTRSLGLKYDYILNKDLRGVGVWALGYDGLNPELEDLLLEKFMK